ALLAFPLLLGGALGLAALAGLGAQPATILAIFHTLSKLLGVTLIWPFTATMVRFLERRFHAREEDPAVLRYLDRAVAATPRLAVDALALELGRIGAIAHRMARAALSSETADNAALLAERATVESLSEATIGFTGSVHSGGDAVVETALSDAVRVVQYYRAVAERSAELGRLPPPSAPPAELAAQLLALQGAADRALEAADPSLDGQLDQVAIDAAAQGFERIYQESKAELLRAGSRNGLSAAALVRALDRISVMRRMIDQATKAARYLAHLTPARRMAPAELVPADAASS
ncbi:MAG: hypothetical protein ACNA7W_12750, partial [Pseudomonadales bacterium]